MGGGLGRLSSVVAKAGVDITPKFAEGAAEVRAERLSIEDRPSAGQPAPLVALSADERPAKRRRSVAAPKRTAAGRGSRSKTRSKAQSHSMDLQEDAQFSE